nr:uncharacterized protein LOC112003689 [Quercus suber]
MGFKRQPQTSLLNLLKGQPGRDEPGKSQPKLPPSPSKSLSIQTRSSSAQSKLPPPPPEPSLPLRSELADPKRRKDLKGKGTMVVQAIYRLEEEANKQGRALQQERDNCLDASWVLSRTEGVLKKRLAEAVAARGVAEYARDEALRAKVEAEFAWTEAKSSKEQVEEEAFAKGVTKTEAALKAQVPEVCRLYCSQTWEEALNQARVEASSDLRRAERVYYPPAIREVTSTTSEAKTGSEKADRGQDGAVKDPTSINRPAEGVEHQRAPEEGEVGNLEVPPVGPKLPATDSPALPTEGDLPKVAPPARETALVMMPLQAVPLGQSSEDPDDTSG